MGIPRGVQQTVAVGVAWTQVIPLSGARESLLLSNPTATPILLSFGVNGSGSVGLYLPETTPPIELTRDKFHNLLDGPIYASAPGGATTLVYLEVLS